MKVEEVKDVELREWIKKQGLTTINEDYVKDVDGYHWKEHKDYTEYLLVNENEYSIKKVGIDTLDSSILNRGGSITFHYSNY